MPDSLFTPLTEKRCPDWLCPKCRSVSLAIAQGSFKYLVNAFTKHNKHLQEFMPEDYTYVFCCLLECRQPRCGEIVAVSGFGYVEDVWVYDDNGHPDTQYEERFMAKYFNPPLPLFVIPEVCPDRVKSQLKEVSSLLTGHPSAAANAIRSLLEMLLDDLDVPRIKLMDGQKCQPLTLHTRIENHPDLLGAHYDAFMALKYFGNAGSHGSEPITQNNLEDACSVLKQLINLLYHRLPDISQNVARLDKAFGKKRP